MKAIFYSTALIVLLTLNASTQLLASPILFEEEQYIEDIPFNTEHVVMEMNSSVTTFNFEEETYINDIPFETGEIVESINDDSTYLLEDEAYINDIPFKTEDVVVNVQFEQAMQNHYCIEEEAYINDIPFETEKIAKSKESIRELGFYFIVLHDIQL